MRHQLPVEKTQEMVKKIKQEANWNKGEERKLFMQLLDREKAKSAEREAAIKAKQDLSAALDKYFRPMNEG